MKKINLVWFALMFLLLSAAFAVNVKAINLYFVVNSANDSVDASPGDGVCADADGKCTLRAAIQETNAGTLENVVSFDLPQPAIINLTLGELHVTRLISIVGPGSKKLTVQRSTAPGTPNFRVFRLTTNQDWRSYFRGFKIQNGNASTGGAVYLEGATTVLFMTDMTVSNNTATRGGAIFNEGKLSLTRSLLNANATGGAAGAAGGALYNSGGATAFVVNATVTENSSVSGGAIYNDGVLSLYHDTVSHNTATSAGGSVVNAASGTANVLNTIIGMDNPGASSLSGAFTSLGGNLITDARGSRGFTDGAGGDQVSDNNAVNPLLGALSDNGGETQTRALLEGSPAIGNGKNCVKNASCPSPYPGFGYIIRTDQRPWHTRVFNDPIDVGAFESNSVVSAVGWGVSTYFLSPPHGPCTMTAINPATNEKQYRTTNPFGNYQFSLPLADAYIYEKRCKRQHKDSVWFSDFETHPLQYPFL